MPNWVFNRIEAVGPADQLEKFRRSVEGADGDGVTVPLTFQAIIARPESEDEDWYRWNIANWGTKWDACQSELDHSEPGRLIYRFETAWAPPEPIYHRLAELHPDLALTIDFEEEQGWGGQCVASGGTLALTDSYDIPETHSDYQQRGRQCPCIDTEPYYPDCWQAAARERGIDDERLLATIGGLSGQWQGDLDQLIEVARAVDAPTQAAAHKSS